MKEYCVTRDITLEECSWLPEPIKKGTIVYEYDGYTYGLVGDNGTAVCFTKHPAPFYEVPLDALEPLDYA
jgi:hypothetical protein